MQLLCLHYFACIHFYLVLIYLYFYLTLYLSPYNQFSLQLNALEVCSVAVREAIYLPFSPFLILICAHKWLYKLCITLIGVVAHFCDPCLRSFSFLLHSYQYTRPHQNKLVLLQAAAALSTGVVESCVTVMSVHFFCTVKAVWLSVLS